MNYFPVYSQLGPGSQYHDKHLQVPQYQQYPQIPSQNFYPSQYKNNDDCASVISDTTINMQSQESLHISKSDIKEKLTSIIDSNQTKLKLLVSTINDLNSESGKAINSKIDEIDLNFDLSVIQTIDDLQQNVSVLDQQHIETSKKYEDELNKVMLLLNSLKLNKPYKRKRQKTSNQFLLCRSTYFPDYFKKRPSLPCICLIKQSAHKTRTQVLKAFEEGKLSCICNTN